MVGSAIDGGRGKEGRGRAPFFEEKEAAIKERKRPSVSGLVPRALAIRHQASLRPSVRPSLPPPIGDDPPTTIPPLLYHQPSIVIGWQLVTPISDEEVVPPLPFPPALMS